ncbi:MAG: tyrosine-type recombinase/integrase [Verrucomicrobiota bacterium]
MVKRGTVWYVSARVNGKRLSISTRETNESSARQVARRILAAARAERWEALDRATAPSGPVPTIGEIVERYLQLAEDQRRRTGRPRPETVSGYVWAFRRLVAVSRGVDTAEANALPATVLATAINEYTRAVVPSAGDNDTLDRARRSAASLVRQARQIFSRWTLSGYADLHLPDIAAFRDGPTVRASLRPDELPPEDLRRATHTGAEALRVERSPLYPVYCLCYYLGLRAGEAAACRWAWFRDEGGRRWLDVGPDRDGTWRPKGGRRRSIPVAAGVWDRLRSGCVGDEWVLAEATSTGRRDLVQRKFAGWMRECGWGPRDYPKAAHELRKLMGSEWYTRYGVEVAAEWLGHADLQTTRDYYAALMRHPAPIEPDDMEV